MYVWNYSSVTENGVQDSLSYEGNGNLVSDGRFFYVYDYLDRLSEVYEIVPGGQTLAASSSGGTSFAQKQCARCMKRKPVRRSLKELQALYKKAKDRYASFKAKANLSKGAPLSLSGTSSTNSTSSTGEMILIAYYGYDPNNRRAYRLLYGTTTWWSYDGWRVAEEMDGSAGFPAKRVHADGIGIDEHLASWEAGSGWTGRSYLQNHQGTTMRLLDSAGTMLQAFEYDAYGARYAYDGSGASIAMSAIDGAGVYGYQGRRLDAETGFYYFRNRYLNVGLGRFLTMDPVGRWGDGKAVGNPKGFAGSSSISDTDPFGLYCGGEDLPWKRGLIPGCPLKEKAVKNRKGWVPSITSADHKGTCYRSLPNLTKMAQQCCYDKLGNLIEWEGAGTLDWTTMDGGLFLSIKHLFTDYFSWRSNPIRFNAVHYCMRLFGIPSGTSGLPVEETLAKVIWKKCEVFVEKNKFGRADDKTYDSSYGMAGVVEMEVPYSGVLKVLKFSLWVKRLLRG